MEFTSFLKASQTYGSIEDFHKTGHKKTALETFCQGVMMHGEDDKVEEDKENEAEEPKDDEDDDDEDKNDGNDDDEDNDEDKNEDQNEDDELMMKK